MSNKTDTFSTLVNKLNEQNDTIISTFDSIFDMCKSISSMLKESLSSIIPGFNSYIDIEENMPVIKLVTDDSDMIFTNFNYCTEGDISYNFIERCFDDTFPELLKFISNYNIALDENQFDKVVEKLKEFKAIKIVK